MAKVVVKEGQTVWDICLQEYGSVSGIGLLMNDNPGVDLQKKLVVGQILIITSNPINKDVVNFYKNEKIIPISGDRIDTLPKDFNQDFNQDFN